MKPKWTNTTGMLRDLENIRNKLEKGEIAESKARAITYMLATAGNLYKSVELEKRLEQLEERLEDKN